MKIYIVTDLEGISGIDSMEMMQTDSPQYDYCLRRLMADTNTAVDGAFTGGADEVAVWDGHSKGTNFIPGMLDSRALKIGGKFVESLDISFDAIMFVGTHAMAGTLNGFLDHTQNSKRWYNYYVNGRKTGEIGQWGIIAGHYDIPVIMVSGDQAACVEAGQFFGPVECAVVKYGIGRNKAMLVDEEEALKRIREAARKSISRIGEVRVYKPLLPLDIKLELYRSDYCDELSTIQGVERIDARMVRKIAESGLKIFF